MPRLAPGPESAGPQPRPSRLQPRQHHGELRPAGQLQQPQPRSRAQRPGRLRPRRYAPSLGRPVTRQPAPGPARPGPAIRKVPAHRASEGQPPAYRLRTGPRLLRPPAAGDRSRHTGQLGTIGGEPGPLGRRPRGRPPPGCAGPPSARRPSASASEPVGSGSSAAAAVVRARMPASRIAACRAPGPLAFCSQPLADRAERDPVRVQPEVQPLACPAGHVADRCGEPVLPPPGSCPSAYSTSPGQ